MLISQPSNHFIESKYPSPLPCNTPPTPQHLRAPVPGQRVVRPPGTGSCHKLLTAAQQGAANKRHPTSCVCEIPAALPRVATGWLFRCVVLRRRSVVLRKGALTVSTQHGHGPAHLRSPTHHYRARQRKQQPSTSCGPDNEWRLPSREETPGWTRQPAQ